MTRPVAREMPPSACNNSDCPLPATPAIPKISPARMLNETPFNRSTKASSRTRRSVTDNTTLPGVAGRFSTSSKTLRPTINSASASGLVSAVLTVATIVPRRITLTLSVVSMISRSLWVIRITVLP